MVQQELIIRKEDLEKVINTLNVQTIIAKTTKPTCESCGHVLDEQYDFVSIHLESDKTIDWEKSDIDLKLVFK